jgi:hypothetical protein
MNTLKRNYYDLDLSKINDKFEGDLTYLGDTAAKEGPFTRVYSVFKAAQPNRAKGHKEYMLIHRDYVTMTYYVSGREETDMEKLRYVSGLKCKECGEVLVSLARHDYQACNCENNCSLDGGLDYIKRGAKDLSKVAFVTIDLLTGEVKNDK